MILNWNTNLEWNIADILSRKPFFDTSKVNEAEHLLNYVVSNSISKTFMKFHEI